MKMRCPQSKLTTVRAMQSIGFETVAAGDSYNDLDMLLASRGGLPLPHDGEDPRGVSAASGL